MWQERVRKSPKSSIGIFALASFLHDIGSDMVFSVWPIFVTQALGANMTVLGLVDGLGEAMVSLSQAVSGYLSDRFRKRKIFVWLGYLFGGISRLGYALSPTWQWLIPFRILDRSGKVRSAPRDAIVSDLSSTRDRGSNFGLLRAMDNLGAVVGILIPIFFLGSLGYRNLFFFAAIPSFIAVILLIIFVKETQSSEAKIFKGIRFADFDFNLKLFTALSAIFALGSFSYSFLLVFARQNGFQVTQVPLMYLLFTIVATIFSLPFGKLSDKIGRKKVLYLSFIFWALLGTLFLFVRNFFGIVAGFIFYGLHKAAADPVQKTLVAELAPRDYVASTLGGFQMIVGLVAFPGSLIAGLLWDRLGMAAPFYFSLILTITALTMLLFVKEKTYKSY